MTRAAKPQIRDDQFDRIAKALADPTRVAVLEAIGREDECPCQQLRDAFPVSKATIASRLSLTPEYFSRVLHELESEGLIAIDKREIQIPDPSRLARYPVQ